jgi:hypothetical protein
VTVYWVSGSRNVETTVAGFWMYTVLLGGSHVTTRDTSPATARRRRTLVDVTVVGSRASLNVTTSLLLRSTFSWSVVGNFETTAGGVVSAG